MGVDCDYHDDHDEFDVPRGNRCGKPATKRIDWRDGRWSLGCDEHASEIACTVPHLVRSIAPAAALGAGEAQGEGEGTC